MNIIDFLDEIDVEIPGYELFLIMQKHDGLYQLNYNTTVDLTSYSKRIESIIPGKYNARKLPFREEIRVPIQEWSYRGAKALGWRIWKAILPKAPDNGFETIMVDSDKITTKDWSTYILHLNTLVINTGFDNSLYIRCVYDPFRDKLYVAKINISQGFGPMAWKDRYEQYDKGY